MLTLKISHRPDGKIADVLASTHTCSTANASVNYTVGIRAAETFMVSIAPMGKLLTCLSRLSLAQLRPTLWSTKDGACHKDCRFPTIQYNPHRLMGDSRFARCLQGGGVYVAGDTVVISSCTISGNQAPNVRAHAQSSHRSHGNSQLLVVCREAVSTSILARSR